MVTKVGLVVVVAVAATRAAEATAAAAGLQFLRTASPAVELLRQCSSSVGLAEDEPRHCAPDELVAQLLDLLLLPSHLLSLLPRHVRHHIGRWAGAEVDDVELFD